MIFDQSKSVVNDDDGLKLAGKSQKRIPAWLDVVRSHASRRGFRTAEPYLDGLEPGVFNGRSAKAEPSRLLSHDPSQKHQDSLIIDMVGSGVNPASGPVIDGPRKSPQWHPVVTSHGRLGRREWRTVPWSHYRTPAWLLPHRSLGMACNQAMPRRRAKEIAPEAPRGKEPRTSEAMGIGEPLLDEHYGAAISPR